LFAKLRGQQGALALVEMTPPEVERDDQVKRRTGPVPALEARRDTRGAAGAQPDAAVGVQEDGGAQAVGPDVLDQLVEVGALERREQLRRRVHLQHVDVHENRPLIPSLYRAGTRGFGVDGRGYGW
jgi:hypothetical protein